MKLNLDEKQAFEVLQKIIDFYTKEEQEKKEYLALTTREYRLLKKILGIDLKEATYRKKDVEIFVRSKDTKHIEFLNPFALSNYGNKIVKYGYFPFQVKKLKEINKPNDN